LAAIILLLVTGFFFRHEINLYLQFIDIKTVETNWEKHSAEIKRLKTYYNSVIPDSFTVYFDVNRNGTCDLTVTEKYGKSKTLWFQQWEMNLDDYHPREANGFVLDENKPRTTDLEFIMRKIGWRRITFDNIETYLHESKCVSIANGNPCEIGFQRKGLGKYAYLIFDKPIPEKLRSAYNDSCRYVLFKDRVVLEYTGGTIGPGCFPDFK